MQSRDIQRLQQIVHNTPDIRQARVDQARDALTAQTLQLTGGVLAPKVMVEALSIAASQPT